MRQPIIYTANTIKHWDCDIESNDSWIPARPVGHNLFLIGYRLYVAYKVLIGTYDILDWEDK